MHWNPCIGTRALGTRTFEIRVFGVALALRHGAAAAAMTHPQTGVYQAWLNELRDILRPEPQSVGLFGVLLELFFDSC